MFYCNWKVYNNIDVVVLQLWSFNIVSLLFPQILLNHLEHDTAIKFQKKEEKKARQLNCYVLFYSEQS